MNKGWGALLATTITTAALVGATAVPAFAANTDGDPTSGPNVTLAGIQTAGAKATDKRIDALTVAIARVEGNDKVTDTDRATILATLNADLDAMHRLADEIAGDTTKAEAAADYHDIFTDYRVYAVALPQALYAAGADALTGTAIPRLHTAYDRLADKVGGDPSDEQQRLLDEMAKDIQDAETASEGLAADALAVTPADWNADHDVMKEIRRQLRDAVRDARDAAHAGREIAQTLR
jgi:hypothetical protein